MKNLFGILFLFAAVSCDLLTTRNPEKPDTLASTVIPATTPDILFGNLKSSIESKIVENYLLCFVDSSFSKKKFRLVPSSGSTLQFPVLSSWGLDSEQQYFKNQKAVSKPGNSITFELTNKFITQFGDSAVYQYDYNLTLSSNDQLISGSYKGTAQFKISLDSRKQWVITEIDDYKKENFATWSELKGRLY